MNNKTPLLQFANWLGVSPWAFFGVTKETNEYLVRKDACDCFLQYDDKHISRSEIEKALAFAELFFEEYTGIYPYRYQVEEERHPYSIKNYQRKDKTISSVKPHNLMDNKYGRYLLYDYGNVTVEKTDGLGQIADDFLVTITLPSATRFSKDSIRVLFTDGDIPREEDLNYNNIYKYEIIPYKRVSQTGNVVVLTIPAYLFVKPFLSETQGTCLPHAVSTYVDQVQVVLEDYDCSSQGFFICKDYGCENGCEEYGTPLCIETRTVYKQQFPVPKVYNTTRTVNLDNSVTCTTEEYCLDCFFDEIAINYVTGKKYTNLRYMEQWCFEIIARLALYFLDCIKNLCNCQTCSSNKIKSMLSIYTTKVEFDFDEGQERYSVLVDAIGFNYADGLKPVRAVIEAMRMLKEIKSEKNSFISYL